MQAALTTIVYLGGVKVVLAADETVLLHVILDLLFRAVEQHGATLLAVTHDHELLDRFDRIFDFMDFSGGGAI